MNFILELNKSLWWVRNNKPILGSIHNLWWDNWRHSSLGESTPIIFNMGITHLCSEVSNLFIIKFVLNQIRLGRETNNSIVLIWVRLELNRNYTPSRNDTNCSFACSDAFTHSAIKSARGWDFSTTSNQIHHEKLELILEIEWNNIFEHS